MQHFSTLFQRNRSQGKQSALDAFLNSDNTELYQSIDSMMAGLSGPKKRTTPNLKPQTPARFIATAAGIIIINSKN